MSLLTNLVAYWPLNEASGQRNDAHTNGLHMTDNNTVMQANGYADFEYSNSEYLSRSDEALLSLGADTNFTWSFWWRAEDLTTNHRPLIMKQIGGNELYEYGIFYHYTSQSILFYVGDGVSNYALATVGIANTNIDTWFHVVAWHDKDADIVGLEVRSTIGSGGSYPSYTYGTFDGSSAVMFGRWASAAISYHDGQMGLVSFWKDRVINAYERDLLYNGGAGLPFSLYPLVGSDRLNKWANTGATSRLRTR